MRKKINRDINSARLEIEHKNDLLRQTLELADEIQKNMLPRRNPDVANFQIAGKSVYCSETGGDYFDSLIDKGFPEPFGVLVGDVTGHGIEAALLMTTARALIRSRALQPGSIAQILSEVNQHLADDVVDSGRFMTLFYLNIDPRNKNLSWVRAGHERPSYTIRQLTLLRSSAVSESLWGSMIHLSMKTTKNQVWPKTRSSFSEPTASGKPKIPKGRCLVKNPCMTLSVPMPRQVPRLLLMRFSRQ